MWESHDKTFPGWKLKLGKLSLEIRDIYFLKEKGEFNLCNNESVELMFPIT